MGSFLLPVLVSMAVCRLEGAVHTAAAPSTTIPSQLPEMIELDGEWFHNGSFLRADGLNRYEALGKKRRMLEMALCPPLNSNVLTVIGHYAAVPTADPKPFAEQLYFDLLHHKTDLVVQRLYDAERGALKKHDFWGYFSVATLLESLVLVSMLKMALSEGLGNPLKRPGDKIFLDFAALLAKAFPQTAYFVARCFWGRHTLLARNADPMDWPRVLTQDRYFWSSAASTFWEVEARQIRFALAGNGCLPSSDHTTVLSDSEVLPYWRCIFSILKADKSISLLQFFRLEYLSTDEELLIKALPVAVELEPGIGESLQAHARERGWKVLPFPCNPAISTVLDDYGRSDSDVHMQLLVPFFRSTTSRNHCPYYLVSPSGKTVCSRRSTLYIDSGNVLHAKLDGQRIYIRKPDGRVVEYAFSAHRNVAVQRGDVIVTTHDNVSPEFLTAKIDCRNMRADECLDRLMSFCFFAKDRSVDFLAVVRADLFCSEACRGWVFGPGCAIENSSE